MTSRKVLIMCVVLGRCNITPWLKTIWFTLISYDASHRRIVYISLTSAQLLILTIIHVIAAWDYSLILTDCRQSFLLSDCNLREAIPATQRSQVRPPATWLNRTIRDTKVLRVDECLTIYSELSQVKHSPTRKTAVYAFVGASRRRLCARWW